MSAINNGIRGRIFSVTGGASGIGAATVKLLATHGASEVWIADWNSEHFPAIISTVADIDPSTKVVTTKVDISNPDEVDAWVSSITSQSSALHGAANVAGLSQPAFTPVKPAILSQDSQSWERVLSVNLNGIMYCTRAQVREMAKMPKASNPAIVRRLSMASLIRGPSAFAYGASKVACAHFTSCVAKDVHDLGIRANTVSPGNTFNPMTKEFFGNMSKEETEDQLVKISVNTRMLDPSDVARSIVWLLSEASLDVNGVNLPVGEGHVSGVYSPRIVQP